MRNSVMNRWREVAESNGYSFVCEFIDKIATAGVQYSFPCLWLTPLTLTKRERERNIYTATLYLLERGTTATIEQRNEVWSAFEDKMAQMVEQFGTDTAEIDPATVNYALVEQPLSGSIEYGIKVTATIYAYRCA